MTGSFVLTCLSLLLVASLSVKGRAKKPHIIYILADDLGWNDVSFHGSDEIFTPNIDALAYNGVILKSHYSQPLCTPSRAALLTGKHPIHTGTQTNVILPTEPWGLPLTEKLLPEYLKPLGYATHAVGKWHLGYYKKEYTPTFRGFDSFFGVWNGYHDYYTHKVQAYYLPFEGYDMRRNMSTDWESYGKYSTDLFGEEAVNLIKAHDVSIPLFLYFAPTAPHAATIEDPLQAPPEEIHKFSYIKSEERATYAAMVSKLDESVGSIVEILRNKNMLEDSIIVFVSDNGAPTTGLLKNYGSNWPLKGEKHSPWEGAVRSVACVWSKMLRKPRRVSKQLMSLTDWLPTLYKAIGGDTSELKGIDGKDVWDVISGTRKEMKNLTLLHNIDENAGYQALRRGKYKYVNGTTFYGFLDDWFGWTPISEKIPPYNFDLVNKMNLALNIGTTPLNQQDVRNLRKKARIFCGKSRRQTEKACEPRRQPCLFDIHEDPCEKHNLYGASKEMDDVVGEMEAALKTFRAGMIPSARVRSSHDSNPGKFNLTWTNWDDYRNSNR